VAKSHWRGCGPARRSAARWRPAAPTRRDVRARHNCSGIVRRSNRPVSSAHTFISFDEFEAITITHPLRGDQARRLNLFGRRVADYELH
jgi:hypothetical protein